MKLALGIVVALATGCLNSGSSKCGDLICPSGTSCMAQNSANKCIDSDLVVACNGLPDGAPCTVPGLPPSTCMGGVCQASRCGDGRITGAEQCDGSLLQGATCLTEGFYNPDGLACGSDCKYDTSSCVGKCGDGIKNGPELCDGSDLGTATCFDVGYYAAPGLKCKADCTFDSSSCTGGHCGDGIINGLEECDGTAMGSATCAKLGFAGSLSALSCSSSCTFSASSCLCTTGRCPPGDTCSCSKTGCDCVKQ